MARIRSIKPTFWADPKVAGLRRDERLMLIGMISMADDEGRFPATAAALAGHAFPHDNLPPKTIRTWRDHIAKTGIIGLYCADGLEYGYFPNWKKHQRISKPYPSMIPQPPGGES